MCLITCFPGSFCAARILWATPDFFESWECTTARLRRNSLSNWIHSQSVGYSGCLRSSNISVYFPFLNLDFSEFGKILGSFVEMFQYGSFGETFCVFCCLSIIPRYTNNDKNKLRIPIQKMINFDNSLTYLTRLLLFIDSFLDLLLYWKVD